MEFSIRFAVIGVSLLLVSGCVSDTQQVTIPTAALSASLPADTSVTEEPVATTEDVVVEEGDLEVAVAENSSPPEAEKSKRDPNRRVCKRDTSVTSRIRKRTCRTQGEWDAIAEASREELLRQNKENDRANSRGGSGLPGGR